ncbi:LysM peptidoglycan-binding domain-containing protein [Desulfotomaculum sp. 1211_IL3151]|uniref:LysM peptidoglycan-binding domain-containing protein n=1 Tax=Desulfotomaculum sp. 1211_IL3151 TaxID=3084055 RepID=UPI002FDAF6BD
MPKNMNDPVYTARQGHFIVNYSQSLGKGLRTIRNRSIEGKTVGQLERELRVKTNPHVDWKLVAGGLLFVIYLCMCWFLFKQTAEVNRLEQENISLKKQIEEQKLLPSKNTSPPENRVATPEPKNIGNELLPYQIQKGDNFAIISQKFYKTEAYAGQLAKLNDLSGTLQIGQPVLVPREPLKTWDK